MKHIGVGFLGCGNIGCGVWNLLSECAAQLEASECVSIQVKKILVRDTSKARGSVPQELLTTNPDDVLCDPDISIVMEFMGGENPATDYLVRALDAGKSVVTANKMALSMNWHLLQSSAKKSGAGIYFEASVCGAIPIIHAITDSLQANRIDSLMGIINGTTNYILTRMTREGASYDDVLSDAQRLGLAEPDPSSDVEGFDAQYKLSILSSLAFHEHIPVDVIFTEGITGVTALDIACGKEMGLVLKLLAVAKKNENDIEVRVHPTFVPESHPLATVSDAFNAVYVHGHACGDMMFYGSGAGDAPTASALVSDLIKAAKAKKHVLPRFEINKEIDPSIKISDDWMCAHFIRLSVVDKPGVLASIAGKFGKFGVGIASMVQKGVRDKNGMVQLIFRTHQASEKAVASALEELDKSAVSLQSVIRVEGE